MSIKVLAELFKVLKQPTWEINEYTHFKGNEITFYKKNKMAVISLKLRRIYLFTVSNNNAFPINFRRKNRVSILSSLSLFTSTSTLLLTSLPKASLLTPYWLRRRISKHVRQFTRREKKNQQDDGGNQITSSSVSKITRRPRRQQTAGTALKLVGVFRERPDTIGNAKGAKSVSTMFRAICDTVGLRSYIVHTQWRSYPQVLDPVRSRDQEGM